MTVFLRSDKRLSKGIKLTLTGSKSESNRLLLLQTIFPNLVLKNCSNSEDTLLFKKALKDASGVIDVHHAGTAMRFLTAYFASRKGIQLTLTGSERMRQRPIRVLVDALKNLGADITYLGKEGFPPLRIKGKELTQREVTLNASISSQYISALLLIAPSLSNGLVVTLEGEITSTSYINMTLHFLKKIGIDCSFTTNRIEVKPMRTIGQSTVVIESDWSSASYIYSLIALSENGEITLKHFKKDSAQGDSALVAIFQKFGVETTFNPTENTISLCKKNAILPTHIKLDLKSTPDIAQSIAVTCFGLNIPCTLSGLHTLKIKESDRLIALKTELEKLGATVKTTESTLAMSPIEKINENCTIKTYEDHRMAMAFAPLSLQVPIIISNPNVVSKSYPSFWSDLQKVGVLVDFQ